MNWNWGYLISSLIFVQICTELNAAPRQQHREHAERNLKNLISNRKCGYDVSREL